MATPATPLTHSLSKKKVKVYGDVPRDTLCVHV